MPGESTHALKVQLAAALREVELWKMAKRNCAESNERLRAEVQRLRGILDRYGCHTLACAWNTSEDDTACDCGLSAALCTGGDRG